MARSYDSFVVRYWRTTDGNQTIQVEHVQSGHRAQVASQAAMVAWIGAHLPAPPHPVSGYTSPVRNVSPEEVCHE